MSQLTDIDVGKAKGVAGRIPTSLRETIGVRLWAWWNVPLLAFVRPSVIELGNERVIIRLPLNRRNRNHLGSMYFAALCAGADAAGGLIAMRLIQKSGRRVSLVFKDFQAEFLKRPEGDVHFTCSDGLAIRDLVERVVASGEREHIPVTVVATVPEIDPDEPVARFVLSLSLKRKD